MLIIMMSVLYKYFVIFYVLKLCLCENEANNLWHSYQLHRSHQIREELTVTNASLAENFHLNYNVSKWTSLCVGKLCHLAGLMAKAIVVVSLTANEHNSFSNNSYIIELNTEPVEVILFENWNSTIKQVETIAIVVTNQVEWFKIDENQAEIIWIWGLDKTITHVNYFQINYQYHLLIVENYGKQFNAFLYQFELGKKLNFWLKQKIELDSLTLSSALSNYGPDYYLSIPQTSLKTLLVYKLTNDHFTSYYNISSVKVSEVVSFEIGSKSFIALNGFNAGIYQFTKLGLKEQVIENSNLDGIHYWLPITLNNFQANTILVAQRVIEHEPHDAFVIEIMTYNGMEFEEHDDVNCLYFGELLTGLTCLPNGVSETDTGIIGSAAVALDGNVLGLLVPRNGTSDLFVFQTEIVKLPNPVRKEVEKLSERQKYLDSLIVEQERELEELKHHLEKESEDSSFNFDNFEVLIEEMSENIGELEENVKFRQTPSKYQKIIFEEDVHVLASATFIDFNTRMIENTSADLLLAEIVMKNEIKPISGEKTFTSLQAEEVNFDTVNNIKATDLLYKTDKSINFKNSLTLENPLLIKANANINLFNRKNLEEEIVAFDKLNEEEIKFENVEVISDTLVEKMNNLPMMKRSINDNDFLGFSENIEMETLYIPHNLNVVKVNGENFNEFLRQICMKNIETYIAKHVTVQGDVQVDDGSFDFLNNLKYPEEYIFSESAFPKITGKKQFVNTLQANEVQCENRINDIDPNEIITLATEQSIPGVTTFNNIEITEQFTMDGNVTGIHPEKYIPNPTLLENDSIIAKVNFKNLEVEGLILLEKLNDNDFEASLADIIYNDEVIVEINSMKTFPEGFTIRSNLETKSNHISDIDLNSIITKNTNQLLNISLLNGHVTFANIETNGLYNSINITKLDQEAVRLTGEQFISGTLIFHEPITTNSLQIKEKPVGFKQEQTTFRQINNQIPNGSILEHITAENVIINGDLKGKLTNFDLNEFNQRRLSLSKDQTITQYKVKNATLNNALIGHLNTIEINQFSAKHLQEAIKAKLFAGELKVKSLFINGSVEIGTINNEHASFMMGDSFWDNDKSQNISDIRFEDIVFFDNIEVENFSGVSFAEFIENVVFINETDVKLSGKTFAQGLTVKKLIETENLNNIPVKKILTRFGNQKMVGPLLIHGNVQFENNLHNLETINEIPVEDLLKFFVHHEKYYQINSDMVFKRLVNIKNLQIDGFVKETLFTEFVNTIIYKNESTNLPDIFFNNEVNFLNSLLILNSTNDLSLEDFVSNIAMKTKAGIVKGPVSFTSPVIVKNRVTLDGRMTAKSINNVQPETWTQEAILVNKGFLPGKFVLEDAEIVGNLRTDLINDIDAKTFIPLRSKQNLSKLFFDEVTTFNNIAVGNLTNSHNLSEEFSNTVMMNLEQEIDIDLEFVGNVFIEGDITLHGALNEKETSTMVTLNTNQQLNGIYDFRSKVTLNENLWIKNGLINGINITNWLKNGLRLSSINAEENIANNWLIENDLIFESDVTGEGLINGQSMQKFQQELEERRNYKYSVEKNAINNYENICKDLTFIHKRLEQQIYKFNYLEMYQVLDFKNPIRYAHHFQFTNKHFLLINEEKSCNSHLFQYENNFFKYLKPIISGQIRQIISVYTNDLTYFIARTEKGNCKIEGTDIWQVVDEDLIRVMTIDELDLLQDSQVPGTFYGLADKQIIEFKLIVESDITLRKYRKWEINEGNIAFVPRGLTIGLAVRTKYKLYRLHQDTPIVEEDDFDHNTEITINGNFSIEYNANFPAPGDDILTVLRVGTKTSRRNFLAVASHEETSVKGTLDFIKIFEDIIEGKVFHKVPTYKPSSLVGLEFNNGETLLAFMENENVMQVYEYKGIEGFKSRLTARVKGTKLFTMSLPFDRKIIGVIDGRRLSLIEAVMLGNQVEKDLQCLL